MGVCGSRDAATKPPVRDLSNWKVVDDAAEQEGSDDRNSNPTSRGSGHHATAADQEQLSAVTVSDLALNCVVCHPSFVETQTCLTGWENGSIYKLQWSTATPAVVSSWKPHERAVNQVVVGRSAELLYSCSRDTTIALTSHIAPPSSPSRKQPASVQLRGHNLNVATIAVNDAETTLCSGGRDTQTIFWDLVTGKLKAKNTTSQNVVTCSKWIPLEPLVVQGSEDLTLKFWDERTELRTPAQIFHGYVYFALSVDVSPDTSYILTSSKGFNGVGCEVRVWDRRTGKQLLEFSGHQQDATSCCFLPGTSDSQSAIPIPVTASKDGTVKVWDAAASRVLCEASEPTGGMFTGLCAVSGSTLLASTFHGAVHAFEFNAAQAIYIYASEVRAAPSALRVVVMGRDAAVLDECAQHLRQSPFEFEQLLGSSVVAVWQALSASVERQLLAKKGVNVPLLGKFAFQREARPLAPVFVLTDRFASQYGVAWKRPPPALLTPTVDANLSLIGGEAGLPKEQTLRTLEALVAFLGAKLQSGSASGRLCLGSIGSLCFEGKTVSFAFSADFVRAVNQEGRTSARKAGEPALGDRLRAAQALRRSASTDSGVRAVRHLPPDPAAEELSSPSSAEGAAHEHRNNTRTHTQSKETHESRSQTLGHHLHSLSSSHLSAADHDVAHAAGARPVLPRFLMASKSVPDGAKVNRPTLGSPYALALQAAFERERELRGHNALAVASEDDALARRSRAAQLRKLQESAERAAGRRELNAFLSGQIEEKRAKQRGERFTAARASDVESATILPRGAAVTAEARRDAKRGLCRRLGEQVAAKDALVRDRRALEQAEAAYFTAQLQAQAAAEQRALLELKQRDKQALLNGWRQQQALGAAASSGKRTR
ncbi:hypothetical protein PybrP1_000189 [[Pythium] brassicae (nom. inval.)]|nr:hypothetical protein PybrP1_000189 [[Pythium] brassicae (nom. inval.)]